MQYYDDNDRGSKRAGAIAAMLYIALWVVLMLVVKITIQTKETGEGILVDFGDVENAGGMMAAAQAAAAENHRPSDTPPVVNPEDMMTQDFEEAPEVPRQQPRPERRPSDSDQQQQQQAAPPVEEPPRQPDQRALFPGSNQQANSTSQGVTEGEGRQGSQEGTPGGDPTGSGTGQGGTGFSLAGRSIVGALPQPRYGPNKSGRVVIDIQVDATGKVVRAIPRGQGSTTNDSELISTAMEAAQKAVFNKIEGDGLQTGTITYNFILK